VKTPYLIGVHVWFCLLVLAVPAAAQWRTGYFMQREAAGQTAATIPWSKYTHVIHYALRPTYSSGICGLDTTEGLLRTTEIEDFVNAAHAAGVKAIIGIREDDTLEAITACTAPQNIAPFVELITTFVANRGYDGVDLDWEGGIIAPQYQDLIRRLRMAMPTATLSVAVGITERFMTAAVQYDLDQINIRAYDLDSQDLTGSAINHTWYHSPTLQGSNIQDQAMDILSWYYVYAGNASSKLGLVVPFYGRIRKGCLDSTGANGVTDPNQAWVGPAEIGSILYRDLVNSTYWNVGTRVWDDSRKSQYIQYREGSCTTDAFIPYIGTDQLEAVATLVRENRLGGIATYGLPYEYMAQQVGDARSPLSTALYDAMIDSNFRPVTVIPPHTTATPPVATTSMSVGARSLAGSTSTVASATGETFTYYVDSANGSDSNPGTLAAPWKTIAKVNSTQLTPGQSVGFKSGGTWREQLTPGQSGSALAPITFTAYGSGVQPIINGSDIPGTWTPSVTTGNLFSGTFQSGNFSAWTGATVDAGNSLMNGTTPVNTGSAYNATSCSNGTAINAYVYKTISAQSTFDTRFYFYIPSDLIFASNNQYSTIFALWSSTGAHRLAYLRVQRSDPNLQLVMHVRLSSDVIVGSPPTITTNAWHYVDLHYASGTSSGGIQWWLDGSSIGSNFTGSSNLLACDTIRLGPINMSLGESSPTGNMYWDTVDVNSTGPIGPVGYPNVWDTTVAAAPAQVFNNGLLATAATSKAALTEGEWFASGTTLSYYESVGNPSSQGYVLEASVRNDGINLNSHSHVVVDGLHITKANVAGVYIGTTMSGVTIQNSLLDYCYGPGVQTAFFVAPNSSNILIQNNEIAHNQGSPGALNVSGVDVDGIYGPSAVIVQNNNIHDNLTAGVECDQFSSGCIVRSNLLYSNSIGLVDDNHNGAQFIYNTVYGNGSGLDGSGIVLYSATSGTLDSIMVAQNTVYGDKGGGMQIESNLTNSTIKNNLFISNGSYYPELYAYSGLTWTGTSIDYNDYYTTTGNALFWVGVDNPLSFSVWKSSNFQWDAHSLSVNPLLNNPASGDFTLQSGSPAIGAGLYISGVSTTNPPNIGAK
jgi:hypothetical protein